MNRQKKWLAAVIGAVMACTVTAAMPVYPSASDEAYQNVHETAVHPDVSVLADSSSLMHELKNTGTIGDYTAAGTGETRKNVLICDSGRAECTYEIEVPEGGYYALEISYCPIVTEHAAAEIAFSLAIDGEIPCDAANRLTLSRVYQLSQPITQDEAGNDRCPMLVQTERWQRSTLMDTDGRQQGWLDFYLEQGRHTVTMNIEKAGLALQSLRFYNNVSDEDAFSAADAAAIAGTPSAKIRIEGEAAACQSEAVLRPTNDSTDSGISPSDPMHLRYNTIGGGGTWQDIGQSITWECTVPHDGWYKLGIKARQNVQRGFFSSRQLTVDGVIPSEAMMQLTFPYSTDFQVTVPKNADGSAVYIYLTGGTVHELTMTAVVGDMGEPIRRLESVIDRLNACCRQIVMITGTEPDRYTDYYVHEKLPELLPEFEQMAAELRDIQQRMSRDAEGTEAASLDGLALLLETCVDDPLQIPDSLTRLKDYAASTAAWACDCRKQPLEIDYIELTDSGTDFSEPDAGFWASLWYSIQRFFASFRSDGDVLIASEQETEEETLEVWVCLGRDQTQLVREMTLSDYVPTHQQNVDVKLVSGGITEAVLAGEEPDAALFVGGDLPVNLACRGLLADLSQEHDFAAAAAELPGSAFVPYQYDGGTYAMPLTRSWAMLFYRQDLLAEAGISAPPQTWQELKTMLPLLQRHYFSVGLVLPQISSGAGSSQLSAVTESGHTFATLLLQQGMNFYNSDLSAVNFQQPEAVAAFTQWTDFYTKYGFDQQYDAFSRFRTGTYPLVIADYTFHNQLETAAPEIQGLWGMTVIPGTEQADGSISHAVSSNGTGAIIFQQPDKRMQAAAWSYVRWFASEPVQTNFAVRMEGIAGTMGRYTPACPAVLSRMPWSADTADILLNASAELQEIPIQPASYAVSRSLMNAFREVVNEQENPRDTLLWYTRDINEEIARKRKNLGLTETAEEVSAP